MNLRDVPASAESAATFCEAHRAPCSTANAPCPGLLRLPRYSAGTPASGNLIIEGDNLAVLDLLASRYAQKVRCVYLDPPYNNHENWQHYADRAGHDQWLALVTATLEKVVPLLADTGSVWISIDDAELHYLKVAADRIFGRGNFIATMVWQHRATRENRSVVSRNHEYILAYARNLGVWKTCRNTLALSNKIASRYQNPDGDARGPWQSVSANAQAGHGTPAQFYPIKAPSGKVHRPPKGRCWIYTQEKFEREIHNNNIWFGSNGRAVPRLKKFLCERMSGLTPETLWPAVEVGTTADAKREALALFEQAPLFDTPKPEALLKRILEISTNRGDLVLDAYLGSGTTTAVAHKMGRQYIGIERGAHARSHCAARMKRVVAAEPGGISQEVQWQGGGGFDFLKPLRARD